MAEDTKVNGPYPQWKIVVRRPKAPEAAVPLIGRLPDPRKPTAQAPEMEVWGEIPIFTTRPDGTERTEQERNELFRQIVAKSRPDLPSDCTFELVPGAPFWWIVAGVPKITDRCPNHPDQRNNFCRHCGRKLGLSLKAT